jgi:hypothetical protein
MVISKLAFFIEFNLVMGTQIQRQCAKRVYDLAQNEIHFNLSNDVMGLKQMIKRAFQEVILVICGDTL